MRVALAATLFAQPDLLLLDEPTNHLDLEASIWLEDYLARFPGTLIIISHDRDLLNGVVRQILHLNGGRLTMYLGGYDRFKEALEEKRSHDKRLRDKQSKERAHIQSFVDRFRYKATKARQAQSRLKVLARMEPISNAVEQRTIPFRFPKPNQLSPPILTMENTATGYTGMTVLTGLNLQINPDDRIALLGANGNGKSTFLKLLSGRILPTNGKMSCPNNLRIGYFAQHQTEELNSSETPYQALSRSVHNGSNETIRGQLARFGFESIDVDTKISSLSGGEKSRLLFCLMSASSPQLLLLDEPTNHLDMDARESLVHALTEFPGAVIIVSHDPYIIDLVAEHLWLIDRGTCRPFDGDVGDYRNFLLKTQQAKYDGEPENGAPQTRTVYTGRREKRRERALERERTSDLRKSIKDTEIRMETLNKRITSLELALARPEVYEGDTSDMLALSEELIDVKKEMKQEESRWLKKEEALLISKTSNPEHQ